jgi:hypothetical protein
MGLWGSSGEFPQVLKEFHGPLSNPVIPIYTRPRRRRGRMEAGTTAYNLQWTVKLYELLWNLPEGFPAALLNTHPLSTPVAKQPR